MDRRGLLYTSRVKMRVAAIVVAVLAAGCGSARAAGPHTITLTLVRHAQSAANASGLIDTSAPGPETHPQGLVSGDDSQRRNWPPTTTTASMPRRMIRTQETATPTAQALGEPVTVLPGLREIEAGQYEGTPEAEHARRPTSPPRGMAAG